jgi:hypothetical protein
LNIKILKDNYLVVENNSIGEKEVLQERQGVDQNIVSRYGPL